MSGAPSGGWEGPQWRARGEPGPWGSRNNAATAPGRWDHRGRGGASGLLRPPGGGEGGIGNTRGRPGPPSRPPHGRGSLKRCCRPAAEGPGGGPQGKKAHQSASLRGPGPVAPGPSLRTNTPHSNPRTPDGGALGRPRGERGARTQKPATPWKDWGRPIAPNHKWIGIYAGDRRTIPARGSIAARQKGDRDVGNIRDAADGTSEVTMGTQSQCDWVARGRRLGRQGAGERPPGGRPSHRAGAPGTGAKNAPPERRKVGRDGGPSKRLLRDVGRRDRGETSSGNGRRGGGGLKARAGGLWGRSRGPSAGSGRYPRTAVWMEAQSCNSNNTNGWTGRRTG
jgi:hypothetical protein